MTRLKISDFQKFRLPPDPNQSYMPAVPPRFEGRSAIVTDVGRDAVDASGAIDEGAFLRTEKACGPDAPTLASSS
jgi:hypothetical protein